MASFKSNPVYFTALGVIGLAALGAGWAIVNRHSAAEKNAAQVMRKQNELVALSSVRPGPTSSNKEAIEADLRRAEAAFAKMREELKGGSVAEAFRKVPVPTSSTNAFFNLETFVQSTRQKLQAAGITVRDDERFGFATYQSEGPQSELIPEVFLQRQVAEYLLDTLVEARPIELLSFQRERPLTKAEQAIVASTGRLPGAQTQAGLNPDFFEIDARISARVPGSVKAIAFRLAFISDTAALRTLLNKLSTFELPLVVRSVEVEPTVSRNVESAPAASSSLDSLFGTSSESAAAPQTPEPVKPLVEKLPSKFTVTVELIDLIQAPANEATPTS